MFRRTMVAFLMLTATLAWVSAQPVPDDPSALGYLNLHKRHPDAAEGPVEFRTSYGVDQALQRLEQISGALDSFRSLTRRVERSVPRGELKSIGNTDGSMQAIGFHNLPLIVEGSLLKQDYQLRQAEYELARLKHERGVVDQSAVDAASRAYREATRKFQVFWDTKNMSN
jgi:hypothetical protein